MSNVSYLNGMTHVFPRYLKKFKLKFDRKCMFPEFLNFEILFLSTYDIGLDLSSRPN